jgi:hypothetical protein
MANSSERMGLIPIRTVLQTDSMDDALRNRLWNIVGKSVWNQLSDRDWSQSKGNKFFQLLWHLHYGERMDRRPNNYRSAIVEVGGRYFKWTWNEVYDFIEFIARNHPIGDGAGFMRVCNKDSRKGTVGIPLRQREPGCDHQRPRVGGHSTSA